MYSRRRGRQARHLLESCGARFRGNVRKKKARCEGRLVVPLCIELRVVRVVQKQKKKKASASRCGSASPLHPSVPFVAPWRAHRSGPSHTQHGPRGALTSGRGQAIIRGCSQLNAGSVESRRALGSPPRYSSGCTRRQRMDTCSSTGAHGPPAFLLNVTSVFNALE